MKLWTKWKGDRRVMITYSSVKPSLMVTSPHNIDSRLNLSMTTTSLQWPLSSVSKEVIMERFGFIGQKLTNISVSHVLVDISVKCWSMHQPSANHSRGVYHMAVNTPYKTQDLKFKGCKSSFIKSFVSHLYNYLLLWCDHVFLTKFNIIIGQHASDRQATGRQDHQISSAFQMRPPKYYSKKTCPL